jgi:hypothetical protein
MLRERHAQRAAPTVSETKQPASQGVYFGHFAELNDEELQQAILEQTRDLAELDPEFAKQLAQQKRATKH